MSKQHRIEASDFLSYTKVNTLASGNSHSGMRKELSVSMVVFPTAELVYHVEHGNSVNDFDNLDEAIIAYNDL